MYWYFQIFLLGIVFHMGVQHFGFCGASCREGFIQRAMYDHDFSKRVWEEIGDRLHQEKQEAEGKE